MDSMLSPSDIAMLSNNDGWGNNSIIWYFALMLIFGGQFGFNRNNDFGQYATSASQNEILFGQQFQGLDNKIDRIGNGIADSTFALNNAIKDGNASVTGTVVNEGRNIQAQLCAINSNIDNKFAMLEKSQLEQRIAEQSQAINQLQLSQALCGVPKINNYAWGTYPYPAPNGCGCGYGNI